VTADDGAQARSTALTHQRLPDRSAAPLRPLGSRWAALVLAAMLVFAITASALSVQRHREFRTYRNDLGNMVQAVDSTAHGRLLETTTANGRQMSRLGGHVDPILVLFALPWLVWPDPALLLVLQAIIVALAAWPTYRLGLRAFGDPAAAALCAAAVLLYPPIQAAVLDEFHPVTLAIPLLLGAFVALEEDRLRWAVPLLVLAAMCKEEIPLVIAVLGLYFALRKRRRWPLLITAAGAAWFLVAVGLVIPHFNTEGAVLLHRYAGGDAGLRPIVTGLLTHPWRAATSLLDPTGLRHLLEMLWPFGFSSLASPLTLLIALPEALVNLLSSKPQQHSTAYHYVAGEAPFVVAAMVLGLQRIGRRLLRKGRRAQPVSLYRLLAGTVVAIALVATLTVGPLAGERRGWGKLTSPAHREALAAAVATVPAEASVSADRVASHLSARRYVYTFPYLDDAQYVAVDTRLPQSQPRSRALAELQTSGRYELAFSRDGVFVYRRVK